MQTNISFRSAIGLAVLLSLLSACGGSPKSSSASGANGGPMPTSRLTINLTVESAEPGSAVVRVNVNDGHLIPTSYRLDGGDSLRACFLGVCRTMEDNGSIYTPDYIARFGYLPGVDYLVSFNRQSAQSAPLSRVALPAAFTIVTPANHQQVTDGETVVVSWMPAGEPADVRLSYQAECTFSSGPHSFSSGSLLSDSNADGSEPVSIDDIVTFVRSNSTVPITRCSIDVIVRHQLQGSIDPTFDGGFALGVVSRKVNLDYIPR
jgi:hypothetical protein